MSEQPALRQSRLLREHAERDAAEPAPDEEIEAFGHDALFRVLHRFNDHRANRPRSFQVDNSTTGRAIVWPS